MKRGRRPALLAALALAVILSGRLEGASIYQPRLVFRVLETAHFRIYYHQGCERQARRLARIAESVRVELAARSRLPAPGITHVVLANQDDDPNGLATPLPYPTVRLAAVWPSTSDLIANTDDWLRMVFIHEYAHVVQAERTRGWAKVARAVLGRNPISFPNLFLPQWQIEGYATYWESSLTGLGRLRGGDANAVVGQRALGGIMPLDQANGGLVSWPGGNIPYLEGAWFHDYLAHRFGEEKVAALNDSTAGRLPYVSAPAFRAVFQQSLGELWRDFQQHLTQNARDDLAGDGATAARPITGGGYWKASPRFDATGKRLFYSLKDPNGFPGLREVTIGRRRRSRQPPARVPRRRGPLRRAVSVGSRGPPVLR